MHILTIIANARTGDEAARALLLDLFIDAAQTTASSMPSDPDDRMDYHTREFYDSWPLSQAIKMGFLPDY